MWWHANINKELILIKFHYFLALGACAPINPFLFTIGKQRGYSAFVMGITSSALNIPSFILRPAIGGITDAYKCRKFTFLLGEVLMALAVIALICTPGASGSENIDDNTVFKTLLFWVFFCVLFLFYLGNTMRMVTEDTICVSLLGDNAHKYGQQRLWGAVGWGTFSLISGVSVDWLSEGKDYKDYRAGYVVSLICSILDIYVSSRIKVEQVKKTDTLGGNMKKIVTDFRIIALLISTIILGFLLSFITNFLFWYLEDITNLFHPEYYSWIKTIQGLSLTIQCFLAEVPLFFVSSYIIKKIGSMNVFTLAFMIFSIRFGLYSIIENPMFTLGVELLHGFTYALVYSAAISYAAKLAPVGAEGTMQGMVGMSLIGIGIPLGSVVGGYLMKDFGAITTFKLIGIVAFTVCIFQAVMNLIIKQMYKSKNETNETS
ncbi:major facilitator superfamily domain-containing protein 6-like isoform X1 [Adelges cooleyi]|uniref:major facilitator superfamily domain-containing protein 6-like isoform X1 n=1 Tax=Adelges cooleyi TaxID=133065 RepID=UPI00217F5862|nr:major facilitator superfamily domain-containing protein 6-like isoform X1 [Adelges cooleyi]